MDHHLPPLSALTELAELHAFEDVYRAAPWELAEATGLAYSRHGDALLISLPATDAKAYNRVLGLGAIVPAEEGLIDGALAYFADRGVSNPAFHIAEMAQPEALWDWLAARGLQPEESWLKLFRDNAPVEPVWTDLHIAEIGPEGAADFALVQMEGFGSPDWMGYWLASLAGRDGWRLYVAYDGPIPAAAGAMYCHGGVGWMGFGATRPDYRRRGGQGALMARRLQDGMEWGCQWFATEAWEPFPGVSSSSLNNMLRSGFHIAHRRLNFAFPW